MGTTTTNILQEGRKLEKILNEDISAAAIMYNGRYPIHLLLENCDKSKFDDDIIYFAVKLILAYPQALLLKDHDDRSDSDSRYRTRSKFLLPILNWIDGKKTKNHVFTRVVDRSEFEEVVDDLGVPFWTELTTRGFLNNPIDKIEENNSGISAPPRHQKSIAGIMLELAQDIPEDIVWIFDVLSLVIETGHRLPGLDTTLEDIAEDILADLASYDGFMRTFILMDSSASKISVFSSTLMKLIMLQPMSIPKSLANLLANNKYLGSKGLEFLRALSALLSVSVGGIVDQQTRENVKADLQIQQENMYSSIAGIPDLLSATRYLEAKDRCSLKIIQRLVDHSFHSSFPRSVLLMDLIFNFLMFLAFNSMVWASMINVDIFYFMIAKQIVMLCFDYFFIREVLVMITYSASLDDFFAHVFTFWSLVDIGAILCTLIASLMKTDTLVDDALIDHPFILRLFIALAVLLQSLKLIKQLRMCNQDFAVFILSVGQIAIDIKWFLVVMVIVMISFSLVFVYLQPSPESLICRYDEEKPCIDSENDLLWFHVKGVYGLMLGDTASYSKADPDQENYLVFVSYTVIVTIILFNILVAIACQSFGKLQQEGPILFRKERMEFAAELRKMQRFLAVSSFGLKVLFIESFIILAVLTFISLKGMYGELNSWRKENEMKAYMLLYVIVPLTIVVLISIAAFLYRAAQIDAKNEGKWNKDKGRFSILLYTFERVWGDIEITDDEITETPSLNPESLSLQQCLFFQNQQKQILAMQEKLNNIQDLLVKMNQAKVT